MISPEQMVLRLFVAAVLGSIVGLERGRMEQAAGLRTHALVGIGAALFMLVSAFGFQDVSHDPHVMLDPSRVAAQVVSGIGFLGAGTIIFQRESIRGLTTAASLWAVAAIGLAVGGGLFVAAIGTTVFMLIILAGIRPVERHLYVHRRQSVILMVDQSMGSIVNIKTAVEQAGLQVERLLILPSNSPDEDRIEIALRRASNSNVVALVDSLRRVPGVHQINSTMEKITVDRPIKHSVEPT